MKRHIRLFLAGVLVVVPFAITAYVIWWLAAWLGSIGYRLTSNLGITRVFGGNLRDILAALLGVAIVVAGIYIVGLLTHSWVFRKLLSLVEQWIARVPGVKTIYESVRDLMKLFGGDSARMGRAVFYKVPNSEVSLLGILTNENPEGGVAGGEDMVALYIPFSYMFGGLTVYVSRNHVQDAGMSVDQALKLCATAHVTGQAPTKITDLTTHGAKQGG